MKKYLWFTVIFLISIVIMTGCGQRTSESKDNKEQKSDDSEKMPVIVMEYTYEYYDSEPYLYKFIFIDNYGNIYRGDSESYFCTAEERMTLYESLIKEPGCELINTINMEQLQEKYEMLKQIESSGKNEIRVEESTLDVCLGQHKWTGYCYDKEGGLNIVTLYGEGDSSYINSDSRARELANWIDSFKVYQIS